ncbi:Nucleolar protein 13 [Neonectria punicea]|uniref:Nucleolar protein 13 n=1 Tax=Neonectria punicea TaxID=979145 RepID=A0ABR1H2S4_9HYPO
MAIKEKKDKKGRKEKKASELDVDMPDMVEEEPIEPEQPAEPAVEKKVKKEKKAKKSARSDVDKPDKVEKPIEPEQSDEPATEPAAEPTVEPAAEKKKAKKAKKSARSDADKPEKAEEPVEVEQSDEPMADTAAEPTPSGKRKAAIDEIEVDVSLPEPPSKRARRALKKGKSLPAKQDSDDDTPGEKKDKKESTRSEHCVWVGNLPFFVTPAELRKWLVDNSGEVISDEMITRVKLPTSKEPGRDKTAKPANKGFAYVDFTDIGPKVAAIALSENELGGRKLLIKDSKSFEGRPKKEPEAEPGAEGAQDQVDPNASRKIFVGNMGFKTTDEDLSRNFEKCGEIDWVKVATFEDSGKCKGYGWVKFREPEGAAWAVKGFVKIKEEVETEQDFKEGSSSDDSDDDDEEKKPRQKQFKMRKWWVNRMMGRELKIELAEDDQVRYKKRFKKNPNAETPENPRGRPPARKAYKPNEGAAGADGAGEATAKPLKEAADIAVARLTGAVVKHTGSKMTFD